MKSPPPVRCVLRPSRIGLVLVVLACGATAVLLASLQLPGICYLVGSAVIAASLKSGFDQMSRRLPRAIEVALDRRIVVDYQNGPSRAGSILDDSYVGASLTTIVWRADGAAWWHRARTIVLLPDMADEDAFRRVRIALRYGRPPARDGSSELEAG